MIVTRTIEGRTYTAEVDDNGTVTLSRDGVWAGEGRWDGRIEDCAASLPDEVFDALDSAIAAAMAPR
jgi:hypothetical protein